MFEIAPSFIQGDAPVEADDVGSGLIHRRKQRSAVSAEINYGSSSLLQALDERGDMRQNIAAIIFHTQTTDPTIERLNDVGSGAYLRRGTFYGHIHQTRRQLIARCRR